jgi:hypothetical protein
VSPTKEDYEAPSVVAGWLENAMLAFVIHFGGVAALKIRFHFSDEIRSVRFGAIREGSVYDSIQSLMCWLFPAISLNDRFGEGRYYPL